MTQQEKAQRFLELHKKGDPVVLYNVWDAGSAKAVAASGAHAIATGSAPVAMAQGFADGERIPLDYVLANIERIIASLSLPVSLDFEGGYGVEPEIVGENFSKALQTGVVGLNFEDQIVGGEGLHSIPVQVERIKAARQACDASGSGGFINARTDIFLKAMAKKEETTRDMLEEAITRAAAFAEAGASGFFAPALMDLDMIAELCDRVSLPVNIIALPGAPDNDKLASAGVARISYGPVPYKKMVKWLEGEARNALGIADG